jgi:PEP-CTERM motif-containing protein
MQRSIWHRGCSTLGVRLYSCLGERYKATMKATRVPTLCGMMFSSVILLTPNAAADSVGFTIPDPNIIGFANPTSCGGSTLCNGGSAYNLSQISSWFSTPTSAQSYLVVNDTGKDITDFTLTFTGTFQATAGSLEVFQCNFGSPGPFSSCSITGSGGTVNSSGGSSVQASFAAPALPVTFEWKTTGAGWLPGTTFDLQTASWVNNVGGTPVPEPSTLTLLGGGFFGLLVFAGLRRRGTATQFS